MLMVASPTVSSAPSLAPLLELETWSGRLPWDGGAQGFTLVAGNDPLAEVRLYDGPSGEAAWSPPVCAARAPGGRCTGSSLVARHTGPCPCPDLAARAAPGPSLQPPGTCGF